MRFVAFDMLVRTLKGIETVQTFKRSNAQTLKR